MALLLLTLFTSSPQMQAGFLMSELSNKLSCHFYHANIFHLAANAFALWVMRPSPSELAKAYPIAVLAMMFTNTPTIGISAVIYAYLGLNIIKWKVSMADWAVFIAANLITLFIPNVAFAVHMSAFAIGLITYKICKKLKRELIF